MSEAFHLKYRPQTLDDLIGHEAAVTRLKGMVKSGKLPNAILLTGPSSAGKTTLARALAAAINGKPIEQQRQCYMEVNGSADRSIDDIRNLIGVSRYKPDLKKRIIVIDEAQGVLTNAAAAAALLKPLEEPSPDTLWILCSMDPQKFGSGNGKAIANRCAPFVLEPHSNADLYKQGVRIIKGEGLKYINKELLKEVVRGSGAQMRNLANLLQALREYYDGLDKKPKLLSAEDITSVLASTESQDDKLAVEVIVAIFAGQYAQAQKALLNVGDGFRFIQTLLWVSGFLLNVAVLNGARHPKVWWNPTNKAALEGVKQYKPTLGQYAAVQAHLVELKARAAAFAVGETELISATVYRIIKDIHTKKES